MPHYTFTTVTYSLELLLNKLKLALAKKELVIYKAR